MKPSKFSEKKRNEKKELKYWRERKGCGCELINLRSQDDDESKKKTQALLVIGLHNGNGTNWIGITPSVRNPTIGKNGDDDMFLHVEGPRIQAEPPPQEAVLVLWEGGGHELADGQSSNLHENGRDAEGLRTEGEEGVEED